MTLNENNIIPLWDWVLVKRTQNAKSTEGGVLLPDDVSIPSLEVRVIKLGRACQEDHPNNSSEHAGQLFLLTKL